MRQILLNNNGATIARMPRPLCERGTLLVRVHYSLISTGTEVAPLRAQGAKDGNESTSTPYPRIAAAYLGKALRNPAKAAQKVAAITRSMITETVASRRSRHVPDPIPAGVTWTPCGATEFEETPKLIRVVSDESEFGYQIMSQEITVPPGMIPIVHLEGKIEAGKITIGLLDEKRARWIGSRSYDQGAFQDRLIFEPGSSRTVTLVVANAGTKTRSEVRLEPVKVVMAPPTEEGLPQSELCEQGWHVGYSAAGEVVGVGAGVSDIAIGDLVACAGAGKANHADFIVVPRNLACRIPAGCDMKLAATTTVGAIALQGIRRAACQLGETIGIIGLGLIGQLTVQMLRANGCRVLGLDVDPARVELARALGMDAGESEMEPFKVLVRDLTSGRGVDRVLITAATKSSEVINTAMDVARRKGVVVTVGDIGLNIKREAFYRKEIDLLMSTSYGPGRYDAEYEEEGHDYPFAYVRWTLNRNMQAYMELIAAGRLQIGKLIDEVVSIDDAPQAYHRLIEGRENQPLAVLIGYSDDPRNLPEPFSAPRIVIRGHRKPTEGVVRYALVGAGAFGTTMLVPMMQRRKDCFFLRAIVSRSASAAGNFARAHQVEVLASDLDSVLSDPGIDLVVIATRHHEHADQVIRALRAGKHVFVEKPLAISWAELDAVDRCYREMQVRPLLMVGFNRRFSPAVKALKSVLDDRRSPLMLNYRLNGGYVPLDHWVQGAHGGGRNIGEACHMYDVFRSLTGREVDSIAATPINPGTLPYLRNDNFVATLGYADGSIATLCYTALGPKSGLSKERLEAFCDGDAYIVDDFKRLTRASDGQVIWQSDTQDKGHSQELSRFGDAILSGNESPIAFEELVETTAVSLHVEDLIRGSVETAVKS